MGTPDSGTHHTLLFEIKAIINSCPLRYTEWYHNPSTYESSNSSYDQVKGCDAMSEGNTCIAEPNLEVLPLT